jgi:hypothetical protein
MVCARNTANRKQIFNNPLEKLITEICAIQHHRSLQYHYSYGELLDNSVVSKNT